MINYSVASNFKEVMEAWCTVYKQYLKTSLISPNELSIFTFPEYLSNGTAIIVGKKMGITVCTVSAVLDSSNGLPLDNYYKEALNKLRLSGKKLIEIGLLADSRGSGNYTNITGLLAGIARFGVHSDHHDFVIGVHPRRVSFFSKVFGFTPIGDVKDYGKLNTAPVVLLYANGQSLQQETFQINRDIYNNPLNFDFDNRFMFNPNNFIGDEEFNVSAANFIGKIWSQKEQKAA